MNVSNIDLGSHTTSFGLSMHESVGEPVLVTACQRHSGGRPVALDDSTLASHAMFSWRSANVVLAKTGGGTLSYKSVRPVAKFSGDSIPHGLQPADRILRSWDGALFEVVAVHADGYDRISCDLVELGQRMH